MINNEHFFACSFTGDLVLASYACVHILEMKFSYEMDSMNFEHCSMNYTDNEVLKK